MFLKKKCGGARLSVSAGLIFSAFDDIRRRAGFQSGLQLHSGAKREAAIVAVLTRVRPRSSPRRVNRKGGGGDQVDVDVVMIS